MRLSAIMKDKITNRLKPPLMQTWSVFNMFLILRVWSLRKGELWHFSVKFSAKIYRYAPHGNRVFLNPVSFWHAENSKGLSWGPFTWENCFCNQQIFGTRCLRTMSKVNRKPFKIYSSTWIVMCTDFLIILYILQNYLSKWAISVSEMHCLI